MLGKPAYEELEQRIRELEKAEFERQRKEKALREQLLHQTTLMDAILDGIAIIDQTHRVRQANSRFAQMLGHTPEEVLGLHTWDWEANMTEAEIRAYFKELSETQTTFETRHRRKDGAIYDAEVTACGVKLGGESMVLTITRDITQRKQVEEALREKEEHYRAFFEQGEDGVIVLDPETARIIEFNDQACRQLGYSRQEFARLRVFDIEAKETAFETKSRIQKVLSEGYDDFETLHRTKQGENRQVHVTAKVINTAGRPIYHCIWRDVTDRRKAEAALQESERFLQQVFDAIQDGISILDTELNVVKTNGWMEQMYETQGVLVGRKCFDVYQQRTSPCPWCPSIKTIETGRGHTEIVPYPSADKPTGWIELSAFPIKDERGRVVRVIEYVKDITARKKAELDSLRVAKEWQATFDSSNDAIWVLDREQIVVRSNKAAERYFHLPFAQMVGKHCWEIVHATNGPIPECPLLRTRKSLRREKMELAVGDRWFEITVDPILTESGQYDGAVHMVSDITNQKQMIASLQKSEEKFRTLVEQSPLGISLIGRDGRYKYLNPQFQNIFGYTIEDVPTGTAWFRQAFPDEQFRREVINVWKGDLQESGVGRSRPRVYSVFCKNGSRKNIQFRPVTLENLDQFVIYEDTTEKSMLEQQLQQAQKMEAIGTLAGGIAHDFNNILGAILGRAEMLLLDMTSDDTSKGDLQEIYKAALRSADLTRQLLAFARKQPVSPKVINLNETVEASLKMLRRLIGENIDLIWQPDTDLRLLKIDPVQVDQILTNLCVNARDAISKVGKIAIKTKNVLLDRLYCASHSDVLPGDYVMLSVSDDGCGMSRETLDNIFDPFFTTKGVGAGTGLGLSTVYGIVKQNSGHINVTSEKGMGTTFKVFLPQVAEAATGKDEVSSKSYPRGTETVLLVEDDELILKLSQSMLKKHGYTVLPARKPSEALDVIDQYHGDVHLLLTDVVMPEMNGKELKENIIKRRPDMKVLFMSGYTADVIMHEGVLDNDVIFLQKPFSVEALINMVRNVLDAAKS